MTNKNKQAENFVRNKYKRKATVVSSRDYEKLEEENKMLRKSYQDLLNKYIELKNEKN